MSHSTPPTLLVWSMLSSLLGVFLIYHLWCFDRFKCLRWSQDSQGTFKRVMTYSYLLSVPLIIVYSVGFCIIKYKEGYIVLPLYGIVPTPHQLWTPAHKNAILPLYLCLSWAWGLEMVTHLEELCFWLFVVNAGPMQKDWFRSLYFKTWIVGSVMAIFYMPLVTILTRHDPLKCEAYTFLAGSLGSLSLTLWFLPVLHLFRPFLGGLRKEGVDTNTIIRLTKFHELNTIRVVFRLLFAVPLFILAVDGVRPHQHINDTMFGTEFLAITGGFGVVISSGITLVIFFPRSIENEIVAHETGTRSRGFFNSRHQLTFVSQEQELFGTYDYEDAQIDSKGISPSSLSQTPLPLLPSKAKSLTTTQSQYSQPQPPHSQLQPPQRQSSEPIPLIPNRRAPTPNHEARASSPKPMFNSVDRFHNPATMKISQGLRRPSFRAPIDLRGRPWRR
ncbi:hypothetical protein EDB92DRAFT_2102572 [Lactarius akahatsu]|uniref:Uncharacterized protein n=1 Tax=Lactarius akahatsu TaxID=416441 RepID=A0AAD4LND7_9AGAM|nr:hypothetical protein EDB92DRAFT_2102572 [Lactarius akahatsu]